LGLGFGLRLWRLHTMPGRRLHLLYFIGYFQPISLDSQHSLATQSHGLSTWTAIVWSSPKSQLCTHGHGCLHGNPFSSWGLGRVLRVGSSKKLDPTLNPSPVNCHNSLPYIMGFDIKAIHLRIQTTRCTHIALPSLQVMSLLQCWLRVIPHAT
jgi:hypothetical protein